jgi:hypothetical protein
MQAKGRFQQDAAFLFGRKKAAQGAAAHLRRRTRLGISPTLTDKNRVL